MTDTTAAPPAASEDGAPGETGIRIIAQFVRDFSFESPHAPDSSYVASTFFVRPVRAAWFLCAPFFSHSYAPPYLNIKQS